MMWKALLIALAWAILGMTFSPAKGDPSVPIRSRSGKPNILLIVADDK